MAEIPTVDTFFKEGKDAHAKGVLRSESPYHPNTSRYREWVAGWDAALKARRGDDSMLGSKPDTVPAKHVPLVTDGSEDNERLTDFPTER